MRRERSTILAILLFLVVGFAAVTGTLVINGTLNFAANEEDFDIYFSEAILDGVDETNTIISEDRLSINFASKELVSIGDKSILEYEVTNASRQYDAEVKVECAGAVTNVYTSFDNTLKDQIIPAQTKANGTLTVTLDKVYAGDGEIEEEYTCTIIATAVERETISDEIVEAKEYYANGYLSTEDGGMLANTGVVIYIDDTPQVVTTDARGFFHMTGLEGGSYVAYVVENLTKEEIEAMTKDDVIAASTGQVSFNTSVVDMSDESLVVSDYDIGPGSPTTHEITLDVNGGLGDNYQILTIEGNKLGRLVVADHETLVFDGWYDGDVEYTKDTLVTSDIVDTLLAKYTNGVAMIGSKEFRTIQQAVDYITITDQTEIDVIASHSLEADVETDKNVVLDLNQNIVDFKEYAIINDGTLAIDNGTINSSGDYGIYNANQLTLNSSLTINKDDSLMTDAESLLAVSVLNDKTGTTTINGTTMNGTFTKYDDQLMYSAGTMNITGATLKTTGTAMGLIRTDLSSTLNITGGTFDNTEGTSAAIVASEDTVINIGSGTNQVTFLGQASTPTIGSAGEVNVNGGNITSTYGYLFSVSGNLELNGGTITINEGAAVHVPVNGVANLNAGTVSGNSETAQNPLIYVFGELNVEAGTYTTAGTVGSIMHVTDGATANITGGTFDHSNAQNPVIIETEQGVVNIGSGTNVITINGASSLAVIYTAGEVNVNGGVINANNVGELFATYGETNIKDGTINAVEGRIASAYAGATLNITGGSLTQTTTSYTGRAVRIFGVLNMSGGTLKASGTSNGLIQCSTGGVSNITGGTFDNSASSNVGITGGTGSIINLGEGTKTITFLDQQANPNIYSVAELNVNGGVMSSNAGYFLYVLGTGTINAGTITSTGEMIAAVDEGTLTINGGTFRGEATSTAASSLRLFANIGTLTINDGVFTDAGVSLGVIEAYEGSTTTIKGGTFTGDSASTEIILVRPTAILNVGELNSTKEININGLIYVPGTANIYSGTITNTSFYALAVGASSYSGVVNIYGGQIINNAGSYPTVLVQNGTLTMSGGSVINNGGYYTIYCNSTATARQTGGVSAKNYNVTVG